MDPNANWDDSSSVPKIIANPAKPNRSTKGGFIPEVDNGGGYKTIPVPSKVIEDELFFSYPLESNNVCKHCSSIEINQQFSQVFKVLVCDMCKKNYSDLYTLITKTAAKDDFLLTDEELNDSAILPHLEKPNPHKSTWSSMFLYMSGHVRDFAINKWGSLHALDEEISKRQDSKDQRQAKKFKEKLADLRKKTRSAALNKRLKETTTNRNHEHSYISNGESSKKCIHCGLIVDVEEF